MNVSLMNEKYINALFMSDYILCDGAVISNIYLMDGIELYPEKMDFTSLKQTTIGLLALLFNSNFLTSMDLKRIAGLVDNQGIEGLRRIYTGLCASVIEGCYSEEITNYFKSNNRILKAALKSLTRVKRKRAKLYFETYEKEKVETGVKNFLKDLMAEYKVNDKEYRFCASENMKLIEKEFKMYSFETEEMRQDMYHLWTFVCDIPEIYREYIKAIDLENVPPEGLNRILFYRRLVDVGCQLSPKDKIKEIKNFEFGENNATPVTAQTESKIYQKGAYEHTNRKLRRKLDKLSKKEYLKK